MKPRFEAELSRLISSLSGRDLPSSGFAAVISPAVAVVYPAQLKRLIGLLRAGGARSVLPVASGISAFASACAESIRARGPGIHVLSACPAALDYLAAQFPRLAGRVLDVPSPMALSAEEALRRGGMPGGCVVAVSSCSLKKKEEGRVPFDLRVVAAGKLFKALGGAGCGLGEGSEAWIGEGDFDEGYRNLQPGGCTIPELVVESLAKLGLGPVSAMKLEGAAKAREALSELSELGSGQAAYTVVELSFCENGCVREPSF
jgi:hypothetical protein